MSSPVVLLDTALDTNVNAPVARRLAEFHPNIWGDYFVNHIPIDKESIGRNEERIKELKEEVKSELLAVVAAEASQQLKFIDAIQRLGVGYLFHKEIDEALQHIYETQVEYEKANCGDLFNVALRFRLLRQQGYNISCDIFNIFKDDIGNFSEALIKDTTGMLELYEAAQFRKHGEDTLDKAVDFTTTHLQQMEAYLSNNLAAQVSHALKRPVLKDIRRLQARHYILLYEEFDSHSASLLELAKMDFNQLQEMHKKELQSIARWWKDLDLNTNLPYARDRVVESYFWVLALYFEPQYSRARYLAAKSFAMLVILDDTYDAYGTYEELVLFTKAIERWDISFIDEVPTECMKFAYRALLNLYEEIENEVTKQGRSYHSHYWKKIVKMQAESYLQEAKWLHQKHMPTMEEYLKNSFVSSACFFVVVSSYIGMGDEVTKEAYDYLFSFPKVLRAPSMIGRLLNDVVSHEFEQKREHVPSAVECYIKQYGVSLEEAYKELRRQVEDAWKDINEACLKPIPLPRPPLMRILYFSGSMNIVYERGDELTHVGELMKARIVSVLVDPVPI